MKNKVCKQCKTISGPAALTCPECRVVPAGRKRPVMVFLMVLSILLLIAMTACGNKPTAPAAPDASDYDSAEDYYEDNTEIVSITKVSKSKDISTFEDVTENMEDRGFDQAAVTSPYTMDGELILDDEVEMSDNEEHPTYETWYTTEAGDVWMIYEINGQVMAYPLSYIYEEQSGRNIIVSEKESLTSYDSESNRFFETIPDPSVVLVIVVDEINADTLEELTYDVLDEYLK